MYEVRAGVRWLPVSIHDLHDAGLSGPGSIGAIKWASRAYGVPVEDVSGVGTCVYLPDEDNVGADALARRLVTEWRLSGAGGRVWIRCTCGVCPMCVLRHDLGGGGP